MEILKKIFLLLILVPLFAKAKVYTSISNGDWFTTSIWSPTGHPHINDTAIINTSVTVASTDSEAVCWRLVINSGKTFTSNGTVGVEKIVANYGTWSGSGAVGIVAQGTGADTVMTGGGSYSGQTGQWFLQSASSSVMTMIIAPSVHYVRTSGGYISLQTSIDHKPLRVLNLGFVESYIIDFGGYATTWTQGANSLVWFIGGPPLTNSYDTIIATATGNTVIYGEGGSATLKTPLNAAYYDLVIHIGTFTIPSNITCHRFELDSPSASANMNGKNVTLTENWMNYGTITSNTGTILFNGTTECVIRPSGTETFKNLTVSRTCNLGSNCTVSVSGLLAIQPGGKMHCTCP